MAADEDSPERQRGDHPGADASGFCNEGAHLARATAFCCLGLPIDDAIDGGLDGKATFVLRQVAPLAIPEPSTILLACSLFMGLGIKRSRH